MYYYEKEKEIRDTFAYHIKRYRKFLEKAQIGPFDNNKWTNVQKEMATIHAMISMSFYVSIGLSEKLRKIWDLYTAKYCDTWHSFRDQIWNKSGFYILRYDNSYLKHRKNVWAGPPNPENNNRSFFITMPNPDPNSHCDCGQYEWVNSSSCLSMQYGPTHWRRMSVHEEIKFRKKLFKFERKRA